jgi:hypothetical protein
MKKRFSEITPKSIDQFNAYIANTPMVSHQDLVNKAIEMGHNPHDLMDAALGSVKYEKSGARLEDPLEDILNAVYEKDPTPGKRYVMEPSEAISARGKDVAKNLEGNLGVATSLNTGRARSLPDYAAVRQQYSNIGKLQGIAHGGHELKHQEDFLIRPDIEMKTADPYKMGHHYGGIYEPEELIREVKDLPKDEKVVKELLKQSKKSGLKPSVFTRLRSLVGLLPAAAAAGIAAYAPESKASTVASTVARAVDEGDPLSAIFPPEAGEGEEEEVKKMYEEAKQNKFKSIRGKVK